MQARVDVIVNRHAKRLAHDGGILAGLRAAVHRSSGRAVLHETRSLEDLEAAVHEADAQGTDAVLLAGGDGSYLAGTTMLHKVFGERLPPVGFAPGGTVCTVARNWGLRGNEARYAVGLLEATLAGTAVRTPRPTLHVTDDRGGDRVGFIFGAGLVARFFDAYYDAPMQGYASAAVLVARIFAGTFTRGRLATRVLTPSPHRVTVDGVTEAPGAWSLIAASVVRDLGIHMQLLYRAGERPDAFHVVASALPPRGLAPQVGRVLAGKGLRGEGHVDRLAKELRVKLGPDDGASTYVLDGECLAAGLVTVTPGPVLSFLSLA